MVIFLKPSRYINNYFISNLRIERTLESFPKDKGYFYGYILNLRECAIGCFAILGKKFKSVFSLTALFSNAIS